MYKWNIINFLDLLGLVNVMDGRFRSLCHPDTKSRASQSMLRLTLSIHFDDLVWS